MSEAPQVRVETKDAARCPYCHEQVRPADAKEACRACMAWHHLECWESHTGCSACGAEVQPRPARPARPAERAHGRGSVLNRCMHPGCTVAPCMKVGRRAYCLPHGERRAQQAIDLDHGVAVVATLLALVLFAVGLTHASGLTAALVTLLGVPALVLAWFFNRSASKRMAGLREVAQRHRAQRGAGG